MAETEIVMQHGWALDSTMWSGLRQVTEYSGMDVHVSCAERGYFGGAQSAARFSGRARKNILIVHSLGLHIVPEDTFAKSDLLVIIGGFRNFHDGTERESKLSKITARRMLQKLERDPEAVLNDFYNNCGLHVTERGHRENRSLVVDSLTNPNLLAGGRILASNQLAEHGGHSPPSENAAADREATKDLRTFDERKPNYVLIQKDLELLNCSTIDEPLLQMPKEVLILHGADDAIAPLRHAEILAAKTKTRNVRIHPTADHALPVNFPDWCLERIREDSLVAR